MAHPMKLSELAHRVPGSHRLGDDDAITNIAHDSRQVSPGTLFVALVGAKSDGHDFIAQAMNRGAVAVAVNSAHAGWYGAQGVPTLVAHDTRLSFPRLSAEFYRNPSQRLALVGVTGTNGKTTTSLMIDSIFRTLGERTGLIGTLGALINAKPVSTERTTPESADLQRMFDNMLSQGVSKCVMEVSSEGIVQERTAYCSFDVGVFTNLTQDHLNTHGTMEAYFAQKLRLFTEYPDLDRTKSFAGVVNIDDPYGERVASALRDRGRQVMTYALNSPDAVIDADIVEACADRIDFTIRYKRPAGSPVLIPVTLPIGGIFNVYNALAATGAALLNRVPPVVIQNGLQNMGSVPGRFETVSTDGRGFQVVVDYAHSPDGLENVLRSARALQPKRVICVFGCGGDRDAAKRPKMGKIAADLSDVVVITSDNPRSEEPSDIIAAITAGVTGTEAEIVIQEDRHEAIRFALCDIAQPGDLVVIAGKGHEAVQQFKDHSIPFDDREIARQVLRICD